MSSFSINKTIGTNPKVMEILSMLSIQNFVVTEEGRKWIGEMCIQATTERKVGEYIDIAAYCYKCNKNERLELANKEIFILTSKEFKEGGIGLPETVLYYELDSTFDAIITDVDSEQITDEFLEIYDYLLTEEFVDIITLIDICLTSTDKSYRYVKATTRLINLIKEYKLTDIICSILENKSYMIMIQKKLCVLLGH
ncbi:hypothetical protein G9F72_019275 [Clostridium estertheticum]|uniref:hypothetical protein n=1 Tax=Clostridium estertheticum TaxID=238834 RepID=UPI0013E9521A|nr:hypothetical protein [Clostridium estertheticum]MBZ9688475.1 hypothetical protein [Clostridium estertheticum]